MPHIVIEYSANLESTVDIGRVVDTVHSAAIEHGLAAESALRTRAAPRRHFRVADGDPTRAFVAIVARIGPGRSPEEKRSFVTRLIDAAESACAPAGAAGMVIAFSAEVQEIDADFRINRNHVRTALEETS